MSAVSETKTSLSILPAAAEQIPVIVSLAHAIWPQVFAFFLESEQIANMLEHIYSPESLAQQMREEHHFWIAYEGQTPIGYVSAYREDDSIWIKKLYVLPGKQGLGAGAAMMQTAGSAFGPAKEWKLLVNEKNLPAQRFYEKHGFRKTAEIKVMMGDFPFTDYLLTKPL